MEKNADLAKAINAINTRDDKAKFLLYDTIDDPVVQSFYDMLAEEEEEASPEDSQTENRYVKCKDQIQPSDPAF